MREPSSPYALTNREVEVAELVSRGMSNVKIADIFGTSTDTVKRHLKHVYMKLGYSSRVRLAVDWSCPIFQLGLEALGLRKAGQ